MVSMNHKNPKGTIAYAVIPKEGGPATFYLNWARGLRSRGWTVYSVAVGKKAAEVFDSRFADDFSVLLGPEETDPAQQVRIFLEWVKKIQADIVIPSAETNIIAAIPHLSPKTRCINICHGVLGSIYRINTLYLIHLKYVVAISQRQLKDFKSSWDVPEDKLRLIPHGIDPAMFRGVARSPGPEDCIRLVFIGRIDEVSKGVMLLPKILEKLHAWQVNCTLHLGGSGRDLSRLQAAFRNKGLEHLVQYHGKIPYQEVPTILSQSDVFVMPSHFEGFPMALIEAMAAGCVPVTTQLQGITDMVIEEGINGFLCPMGRAEAFAEKIACLWRDRDRLARMAVAARDRVVERFSLDRMAAEYDALFTEVLSQPPVPYTTKPLADFKYPKELLPTWRSKIPMPVKNWARPWLYRLFGRLSI